MEQAVNTIPINCCILKHLGVKNIEIYKQLKIKISYAVN